MAASDLCHLVYTSHSRLVGDPDEVTEQLNAILEKARSSNADNGITGALLLNGDRFAQVLEGTQQAITDLYFKILEDSRHDRVRLLSLKPVEARTFADWSMALVGRDAESDRSFGEIGSWEGDQAGHMGGAVVVGYLARHLNTNNTATT